MEPIEQYLAAYAEPEGRLGELHLGPYERVLVVPVRREEPTLLDGYQAALTSAAGRTLVVVVVNATLGESEASLRQNAELSAALRLRARSVDELCKQPPIELHRHERFDVLLVDRSTPPFELPTKQGVGLARRVGADIALSAIARGQIASPWIFCTDADVELPGTYFSGPERAPEGALTTLFPFVHDVRFAPSSAHGMPGEPTSRLGLADLDTRTALSEISLRYYVLGLSWAGSPYAFHTLGSALCVHAQGYATVRGMPRRLAGEDFHLLAKLAKVGAVFCADVDPILIRARESDRVPFGTGPRVDKLRQAELELYPPEAFLALRAWLARVDEYAADPRRELLEAPLSLSADLDQCVRVALRGLGAYTTLPAAAREAPRGVVLRRRVHTWFDALKTLRFIHAIRDAHARALPWRDALRLAPFIDRTPALSDVESAWRALQQLDMQGRKCLAGPAAF